MSPNHPSPASPDPRSEAVKQLARQLRRVQRHRSDRTDFLSTGIQVLDRLLPGGGIRPGSLMEWMSVGGGSGGMTTMFVVAAQLVRATGTLMVIDPNRTFYPVEADLLGIDLDRTVIVQPRSNRDTAWAFEQSLRCRSVAVAICCLESINDRIFRRLQLAAETGGGVGLLWRSASFQRQPSWADTRLLVQSLPPLAASPSLQRRLRLELLHSRGRMRAAAIELAIDDTGSVRPIKNARPAEQPSLKKALP